MTDRTNPAINRRQALVGLGSLGLGALFAACGQDSKSAATTTTTALDAAGSCAVVPELTEGPYYIDLDKVRSDIREDRQGTPLTLSIRVRDFGSCTPRANAVVDLWHCDATGNYSGFEGGGGGPGGRPGGGGGANPTTDTKRYLRGSQVTGADGIAQFVTIYPGWYRGRTVHAHVKVHVGNNQVVTSQLFFDEAVTRTVYATGPYAGRTGQDTSNANDGIFARANLLTPTTSGDGYVAAINLDVKTA
jgi:protocatechuate 3,4-dioxygenase beta subunit